MVLIFKYKLLLSTKKVGNYFMLVNHDCYCCNVILSKDLALVAEAAAIKVHSN